MKKILFALIGCACISNVNAADITIYYSPTCPHCHHARDFINSSLIYEYDNLKVTQVNIMEMDNRQAFLDALFKCGYQNGGVPVLVIGEKCFQGYGDSMQNDLRAAVEVGLTDAQKSAAAANKEAMAKDKDAFVSAHADRKNAVVEYSASKKN